MHGRSKLVANEPEELRQPIWADSRRKRSESSRVVAGLTGSEPGQMQVGPSRLDVEDDDVMLTRGSFKTTSSGC